MNEITTTVYKVQFVREIAPSNWLAVADANDFTTAGEAWNWTYDNPLPYEMRVVREVTTATVEPRPSDVSIDSDEFDETCGPVPEPHFFHGSMQPKS